MSDDVVLGTLEFKDGRKMDLLGVGESVIRIKVPNGDKIYKVSMTATKYLEVEDQVTKILGYDPRGNLVETEDRLLEPLTASTIDNNISGESPEPVAIVQPDAHGAAKRPRKKRVKNINSDKPVKDQDDTSLPYDFSVEDPFMRVMRLMRDEVKLSDNLGWYLLTHPDVFRPIVTQMLGDKLIRYQRMSLVSFKAHTEAYTGKRPEHTDFEAICRMLYSVCNREITDQDYLDIIAATAVCEEKSIFALFDGEFRAKYFKGNKILRRAVENAHLMAAVFVADLGMIK